MDIELQSNCTFSLYINGNELIIKVEYRYPKKIFINNFSYDNLIQINKYFKQFDTIEECLDDIKSNQYKIDEFDNHIIFNIIYNVKKEPIKIQLNLKDISNNIEYNTLSNEMKKIIDEEKLILGIDLGTNYSSSSIIIDDKLINIPNEFGLLSTPSYISLIDDKNRYIGDLAKLSASFDKNIIYSVKRLLGKKYNDSEIQKIKDDLPFTIVKEDNSNKIKIQIQYNKNNQEIKKDFYPEQLSAMILNKIKTDSEYYLTKKIGKNIKIKKVVITVPAYFNQEQREATKQSAEIVNLEVVRMINEPTSASLAYGFEKEENEERKYIVVIDFGGGTLDITLLTFRKNKDGVYCNIKSSYGDTNFGGDDFDYILMKKCLNNSTFDKNLPHNIRLKRACEKAKIKLSSSDKANIILEEYESFKDINVEITRNEFETLCIDLFDKFKIKLEDFLTKSKFNTRKKDISKIILIGGTTFIPKIKQIIEEFFPYSQIKNEINPNLAVSRGASIQGAIISNLEYVKNIKLLDVTNLSLGIEVLGEKMSVIIERSQPFPCDGENPYVTIKDNQTRAHIKIYEGESENINENWLLGNFIIGNLPKKPAGEAKINVHFNIDYNSMLNVTAYDLSNENNKKFYPVKKPIGLGNIIEKLKNDEKEMIDLKNIDYDNYKDIIIDIQDKIDKSIDKEQKILNSKNLIIELEKFILNANQTCLNQKMFISYVKYFFQQISLLIKYSNSLEQNFIVKIKEDIDKIFENIQFFDNNILNEIIEDFIYYEDLYQYCLKKLIIHYYEKAESSYFSVNQLIKEKKEENAVIQLQKTKQYIEISKKKYEKIKDKNIIEKSYIKSIDDYETKIEVKNLIIKINTGKDISDIDIEDLLNRYSNSYMIELEDFQELIKIAKLDEKKVNDLEKQLKFYKDKLNKSKNNEEEYLNQFFECLIYFLNSYPPEEKVKYDILSKAKEVVYKEKKKSKMIPVIEELRAKYQDSLRNLNQNNDNDDSKNKSDKIIFTRITSFLNEISKDLE